MRRPRLAQGLALVGAIGVGALALGAALRLDPAAPEAAATATSPTRASALPTDILEALLARAEDGAFERPAGAWRLSLPRDHGAHADARAETWMLAAHLTDPAGRPVLVQFSLSRFGLSPEPPDPTGEPAPRRAIWDLRALYRAHVLVAEGDGSVTHAEERLSRGAGAAGHDARAGEVWLDDWTLAYGAGPQRRDLAFRARLNALAIELELSPAKAAVQAAGGDAPFRAFAVPRLAARGRLVTPDGTVPVAGTAWLDRAWGELPLPGGPLGYDRLQLQLDDGTDLAVVRTRRLDGRGPVTLEGMLVDPSGTVATVSDERYTLAPRGAPEGPDGAGPPTAWQVSGPDLELRIEAIDTAPAPAFALGGRTGLVRAEGARAGRPIEGLGNLQTTDREAP